PASSGMPGVYRGPRHAAVERSSQRLTRLSTLFSLRGYLRNTHTVARQPGTSSVGVHEMAAYLIAEVDVTDPVAYEEYRKLVEVTLKQYNGTYRVRGGATTLLEGEPAPK